MRDETLKEGLIILSAAFPSFKLTESIADAWFKKFANENDTDFFDACNSIADNMAGLPYGANVMRLVRESIQTSKESKHLLLDKPTDNMYNGITEKERLDNLDKIKGLVDSLAKKGGG